MKKASLIQLAAAVVLTSALVSTSSAVTSTNKYEALQGSVVLKGLGTIGDNIPVSDVKVSAILTDQASGPTVTQPTTNSPTGVTGVKGKASKVTNKQIIEAAGVSPTGKKIKWGYYFGPGNAPKAVLTIYDNAGFQKVIDPSILTLNVGWAQNYAGVYNGAATLTAQKVVSGTSVFISAGKLSGLTEISGTYLTHLNYAGVGNFSGDSKKQLSANAKVSAGDVGP
jgi:hypothetical protein